MMRKAALWLPNGSHRAEQDKEFINPATDNIC